MAEPKMDAYMKPITYEWSPMVQSLKFRNG